MPAEYCQAFVYNTTLCTLQLEVYYRYLPTYKTPEQIGPDETPEQINLDDEAASDGDGDIEIKVKM